MSINATLLALVEELTNDGIADPLGECFTLAHLWADLARLAAEPLPADVAALLDGPRPIRPILAAPKPTHRVCIVEPCESCGQPVGAAGYRDAEACIALCEGCAETDREHARRVSMLLA